MRLVLRFRSFFWLLCTLALLAGCQRPQLVTQESYVFGTRVEVIVAGKPEAEARTAVAEVLREFDRLHHTYHAWQPSELSKLNEAFAAGRSAPVSAEMAELIGEAQHLAVAGSYLFDPGIGSLVKLWGFHADEFAARLPDAKALAEWRGMRPSLADVRVEQGRAMSGNKAVALDFGGYLKGVALDRAAAILRRHGVEHALINIGGNVMALGNKEAKADGAPWRVGIQHPRQPGILATVALRDGEAIGTSGDYQRYFELDGRRYCHLLDPRTALPVTHTQAVTVLIPAAGRVGKLAGIGAGTLSDAASKPIFIAGPEGWRLAAQSMGVGLVLRVGADGAIEATKALAGRLQFVGEPPRIRLLD